MSTSSPQLARIVIERLTQFFSAERAQEIWDTIDHTGDVEELVSRALDQAFEDNAAAVHSPEPNTQGGTPTPESANKTSRSEAKTTTPQETPSVPQNKADCSEAKQQARARYTDAETDNSQNGQDDLNDKKSRFRTGHSLAWYATQVIDESETLLGNRYLCRGGGMFVIAPSGMGKSTMSLQLAILWACGLIAFGIKPKKALRILVVQSEDDEGDCTEMARMMNHLGLTDHEKKAVNKNTELIRCNDLVGWEFIQALRDRLESARTEGNPFDLVIVNPYGVYLGADVKDTDACTRFLNQWLNPLLTEYKIGIILIHHTAKTNFQNTEKYSIWDWSYHGAGAACITNWARVIIAIKPEAEDFSIFRFIAAKRGKRIGDEWEGGFEKFFAWSRIPGVLRWEEATAGEIAKVTATKSGYKSVDLDKALQQVPLLDAELKTVVIVKIQNACSVGEKKAKDALNELLKTEKVFNVPIHNPGGSRSFAGVSKTPKNADSASETESKAKNG